MPEATTEIPIGHATDPADELEPGLLPPATPGCARSEAGAVVTECAVDDVVVRRAPECAFPATDAALDAGVVAPRAPVVGVVVAGEGGGVAPAGRVLANMIWSDVTEALLDETRT